MKKSIKILNQKEEAEFNRSVWHNMTPAQRLQIVERLRQNYSKNFSKKNEQGFKRVFKKFKRKKVDYMIVGGIAVAYYGYPRYTGDINIWIKKSKENAQKIIEVVKNFGYSNIDLSVEDLLEDNMVFQFGVEPNRIDLIIDLDGITFEEAEKNKQLISLEDISVYIISLADLKKNKKASGRYKDLDDIENLP